MALNLFKKIGKGFSTLEFRYIRNRAKRYGYILQGRQPEKADTIFIENYFRTNYKKNALLSYLIYPFISDILNNHSNHRECFTMAEILNELEYNVDVIHWNNTTYVPVKAYDLVIDNHNNLERLSPNLPAACKRIFHATNAHWLYQNKVEYERYYGFYVKTGMALEPIRQISKGNSVQYADAISMFGNEFTASTYPLFKKKIQHLPMSVNTGVELLSKNFNQAKRKFVWLNSHGALLKGLDVVLDAFAVSDQLELYICGNLEKEHAFMSAIEKNLARSSNVKQVGWVDMESEDFKNLIRECAFVINSSFSEGGGGSALNCMAKGLIPILSQSASITLPPNTGFYLENNNGICLKAVIDMVSLLPGDRLMEMSKNAHSFVAANHTLQNFRDKYKEFVTNITA